MQVDNQLRRFPLRCCLECGAEQSQAPTTGGVGDNSADLVEVVVNGASGAAQLSLPSTPCLPRRLTAGRMSHSDHRARAHRGD